MACVRALERWSAAVHAVVEALDPDSMEERIEVRRDPASCSASASASAEEVSVREARWHTVEHSAHHLGQIQLTRQWLGHSPPGAE
jgi:uncharacterized damage-inducible protein DinB